MDGILIIDKPEGFTSHDVVARLRHILKTKKIGHTGTLDPFATGVLVMLVGKATRLAQFIDMDEKEYEAIVRFGVETNTGDRTGTPDTECAMENEEIAGVLAATDWDSVLSAFRGRTTQLPPMFSAKKIDGKKLYEHARKGIEVKRKPIEVEILQLDLVKDDDLPQTDRRLRIACSAGTYIRTLAEDLGRKIGTGAHLVELRRLRAGKFGIDESVTLKELTDADDKEQFVRPIDDVVEHLPLFALSPWRVEKTLSGLSTRVEHGGFSEGECVRMVDPNGQLIAIGIFDAEECNIRPKIVLV